MTIWQRLEKWLQSIEVPSWVSWLSMLIKVVICKIPEVLNTLFYKRPQWDVNYKSDYSLSTMRIVNQYEREFKFDLKSNFIYAFNWDDTINFGDQSLINGLYSTYDSIFGEGGYFEAYINNCLFYNPVTKKISFKRGQSVIKKQDGFVEVKTSEEPSGDQLTGLFSAYSEYRRRKNKLHPQVEAFLFQTINEKVLYNSDGTISKMGNFKPNLITIDGDCAIWLTALALSRHWDLFEKYYDEYGYGMMLKYTSVYLFDDRYKLGRRNWFSCNIAIIILCVLFRELCDGYFGNFKGYKGLTKEISRYNNVRDSILKILNNNKHNLFLWLFAKHVGVINSREIPYEAVSYFINTAVITEGVKDSINNKIYPDTTYTGSLMPLGLSKANWIWEREPYKIHNENKWSSNLDIVFVQKLKERYL